LDQVNISPPSEKIKNIFFNPNPVFFYCTGLLIKSPRLMPGASLAAFPA